MSRYKALMAQVEEELQALQVLTRNEIRGVSTAAVTQGSRDALQLMSYAATGTPRLAAGFNRLPVEAIMQVLGFLSPDGALYDRLSKYAEGNGKRVADVLIEGITMGRNPRTIASDLTQAYGMARTDSMRMTRTVNLYAYREANRASYVANADILDRWYWYAALDDRTCASCWALHGTGPYPLYEARAHFERVTAIDPEADEAWGGLGEALARLGEQELSRRMYDRARALE